MEHTAPRRSHNPVLGTFEELTTDPHSTSYGYAHAETSRYPSHDPMPLFLSDPDGEPDPQEFSMPSERGSKLTKRILAVFLACSGVAILGAVFYSDDARVVIANAKASISNVIAEQTAPPHAEPVVHKIPSKDPARVTNPIVLVRADANEISSQAGPSRDAIATAYQSALQSRAPAAAPLPAAPAPAAPAAAAVPAPAPVAAPVAAPSPVAAPAKTLDPETLSALMNRAKGMLEVGDIAPARLLLERAANSHDPTAAFLLAQTYDPVVLGTRDIRTITPDPAIARDWYQKAARLGSNEARARLAQLQN
ncbi:MAG: sel1 repeat family protein [Bradyrhizobium sp.]|uniref:hypothetical protein n=1 Tax=Bradyrhizobium sp. TaxID=376 RepID=UPI0025BE2C1E|nr:hypothetical protein [Bradyrhizobium sp.]MBI5263918.1 sel1 repeat family protein [Bradyrhizobium sp.]